MIRQSCWELAIVIVLPDALDTQGVIARAESSI